MIKMKNLESIFEALSSSARRKILSYLSAADLTAGEIAERFDMSKPAISKHLKVLEYAGLISSAKRGQFVTYTLIRENLVASLFDFATDFCPQGSQLKKESQRIAEKVRTKHED